MCSSNFTWRCSPINYRKAKISFWIMQSLARASPKCLQSGQNRIISSSQDTATSPMIRGSERMQMKIIFKCMRTLIWFRDFCLHTLDFNKTKSNNQRSFGFRHFEERFRRKDRRGVLVSEHLWKKLETSWKKTFGRWLRDNEWIHLNLYTEHSVVLRLWCSGSLLRRDQ